MQENIILENPLLKLAQNKGRHAWAGLKMPFRMEAIDFANSTNYRLSSELHQKFKVVWLYETILNNFLGESWKIILDEAIRLLEENGYIVLKIHNTDNLSIPMVKSFIGRKFGVKCDVFYEKGTVIVLEVHRKNINIYRQKQWTFGILTLGNQVERVCKFLESVRKNENKKISEIIVVGPRNSEYEKYAVKYIDIKQFRDQEYPEVCKKKNAIIEMANNPNLMIVHDRYILGDDFFQGFEEYGYDFDFLTVKQYDIEGNEFPSYCATRKKMVYSGQLQVNNYSKLYSTQYLNGGLLIMKTYMAKMIKFNNIIMWDQMEDVEFSKSAMENGIIPRINFLSSAITLLVKEGYLASWKIDNNKEDLLKNIEINRKDGIKHLLKNISYYIPVECKEWKIYKLLKQKLIK